MRNEMNPFTHSDIVQYVNRFRRLFVIDVDISQSLTELLEEIVQATGSSRVCIVRASGERMYGAYCHKCEDCAHCGQQEDIIAFSRKMQGAVTGLLTGERVIELMSEKEQQTIRFRNPVCIPLSYEGTTYGTLTSDRNDGKPWQPEHLEYISLICSLLAVTFRNAEFYEAHLSQQQILLRILQNLDANIYVTDMETDEILFINNRMLDEYGIKEDCVGQLCWKVLQKGKASRCDFCPSITLKENPNQQYVWEERSSLTGQYYRNTDSVIEWMDGRQVHLQHSVNITKEMETNRSLEEARKSAESANQAKGDFLSRMSHEIRTPINAIIGMARIGKDADNLEKSQQCLEKIDHSSKQLLGIINDILDMSKISANKMTLNLERLDLEHMLIESSNVISVKAGEKNQKLHICMDMDMPRYYLGDELRLSQVVTNLLSNAVKFTPEGGKIRVDVREKARQGKRSTIEIAVTDTGIGIPKENQAELFTSFEQADGGIARKFGGTGLGLAICKSIVELMGGSIEVESSEGCGSTFRFTAQMQLLDDQEEESRSRALKSIDISKLRVLLIDDEPETRAYFKNIMDEYNIPQATAVSGEEGLRLMELAAEEGAPYGIVLVDWHMPGVDGLETTRRIKEKFSSTIVIMISVGEFSDIETQARAAGVARFMTKPLFPSMLVDTINEVIGLPEKRAGFATGKRESFAGYTILLAEDVEINREILLHDLADSRAEVEFAENGRIAVEMFEAQPERYDLILMDVHMPEMNGLEATQRIRALKTPRAKTVPIVAMTANVFREDIDQCLQSGMNDHLAKPIDINILFDKLRYYLIQYDETVQDNTPAAQPAAHPNKEDLLLEHKNADGHKYINLEDGLERVRGNKTIYKTLLKSFAKNDSWQKLCDQLAAGDVEEAAKTAHAIKGMAGNLSLDAIFHTVVLLEAQLKSGFDYKDTFAVMHDAVDKTLKLIETASETL